MTEALTIDRISRNSVLIPSFKKMIVVEYDKILYIKAMENYTRVYTLEGKSALVSISFGKLLNRLKEFDFHQCHKSYAVNKRYVMVYHKSGKIELEGEILVPVSRRRKKRFLYNLEFDNQFLQKSIRKPLK